MKSIIKTVCLSLVLALALVSCKDEASIQNYFVEHQDLPEFLTIDLSPKMIDVSKVELNEEQKGVYKSFEKVNILAYKAKDVSKENYTQELEKVKTIFKNKSIVN